MKAFHPRTSASGCSPSKPELRERPLLARGRSGELAGLFAVKAIPTGAGSGLSDDAKAYMEERDQYRAEQAKTAEEEAKRQEALSVERGKVRAAQEQAAAQRATARAIGATERR